MAPKKKMLREDDIEENSKVDNEPNDKKARVDISTREMFETDIIHPLEELPKASYCKIISWNVAGLRAVMRNHPNLLTNLTLQYNPHVICLQETKLQNELVQEFNDIIPGYTGHWICSEVKKGYSGTVIFIKNELLSSVNSSTSSSTITVTSSSKAKGGSKQKSLLKMWGNKTSSTSVTTTDSTSDSIIPMSSVSNPSSDNSSTSPTTTTSSNIHVLNITYDLELPSLNGEGRTITVEFDTFYLVACYVPNSGQDLKRLDFRIQEWDTHLRTYLKKLNASKPVVLAGDLNVAHLDIDIYNVTAKHIPKSAGTTPEERDSFSVLLSSGFSDVFRHFHPVAKGQFTYWSQRARNRETNRGLRLDYFVCSNDMLPSPDADATAGSAVVDEESSLVSSRLTSSGMVSTVYDCYMLHDATRQCSDHCPIVLVLKTV